jgi:hypothetical protein
MGVHMGIRVRGMGVPVVGVRMRLRVVWVRVVGCLLVGCIMVHLARVGTTRLSPMVGVLPRLQAQQKQALLASSWCASCASHMRLLLFHTTLLCPGMYGMHTAQ